MANPEHLEILKQGVEVWNQWRQDYHQTTPDLRLADMKNTVLIGANFSNADLSGSVFMSSNLTWGNFSGANLSNALLLDSSFHRASFSNAIFRDADLQNIDLYRTSLVNTDFSNAKLRFVNFGIADLHGANYTNVILGYAIFVKNDLSQVNGLATVNHEAPSSIGIDTIYQSEGNIPEVFLRGCGVPENFITYMHSLSGQALEFYACFISFTEADDLFSERLYNNLQGAGVRCWRWKEDAKWGRTLMSSIDEAVRVYDKLIVICSEQSLNSPAVIREIERALQKEDDLARQGKEAEVLFPIRLDDYIFTGWNHHRKADVVSKNVGDFRLWSEPDKYKQAFDRLLRDLKAEEKKGAKK